MILTGTGACSSENKQDLFNTGGITDSCDTTSVTYSGTVKAILTNGCAISSCHDTGTKQSGYDFSTYNDAMTGANRILARSNNSSNPMPPGGLLPECERLQVQLWVQDGAPNN